jgi:hypothetical protein
MQIVLGKEELKEFYHECFVDDQAKDFLALQRVPADKIGKVVDIGGGCGFFAKKIMDLGITDVLVMDTDDNSVRTCGEKGVKAEISDALSPRIQGDEAIVCFNLILHHLIGSSEAMTLDAQKRALSAWRGRGVSLFVNEYVYEGFINEKSSAKLIWCITSSKLLSIIGKFVSWFIPSLKANTFGFGVRFRTKSDWERIFSATGYEVAGYSRGVDEEISLARRLLLIKSRRRDSFLLREKPL